MKKLIGFYQIEKISYHQQKVKRLRLILLCFLLPILSSIELARYEFKRHQKER